MVNIQASRNRKGNLLQQSLSLALPLRDFCLLYLNIGHLYWCQPRTLQSSLIISSWFTLFSLQLLLLYEPDVGQLLWLLISPSLIIWPRHVIDLHKVHTVIILQLVTVISAASLQLSVITSSLALLGKYYRNIFSEHYGTLKTNLYGTNLI